MVRRHAHKASIISLRSSGSPLLSFRTALHPFYKLLRSTKLAGVRALVRGKRKSLTDILSLFCIREKLFEVICSLFLMRAHVFGLVGFSRGVSASSPHLATMKCIYELSVLWIGFLTFSYFEVNLKASGLLKDSFTQVCDGAKGQKNLFFSYTDYF